MKSVKRSDIEEEINHVIKCPECKSKTSIEEIDGDIVQCNTCFELFVIENY